MTRLRKMREIKCMREILRIYQGRRGSWTLWQAKIRDRLGTRWPSQVLREGWRAERLSKHKLTSLAGPNKSNKEPIPTTNRGSSLPDRLRFKDNHLAYRHQSLEFRPLIWMKVLKTSRLSTMTSRVQLGKDAPCSSRQTKSRLIPYSMKTSPCHIVTAHRTLIQ